MTTSPRRSSPASRATRRSRRPAPRSQSFLDRNRSRVYWTVGILAVLLLGGAVFWSSSQPAYACTNMFDPSAAPEITQTPTAAPSQSPFPGPTAPGPGYVEPDMGNKHENNIGAFVRYTWCPPASGKHYPAPGGPIRGGLYGPDEKTVPQGWVHNLEHGAIALLYNCTPDASGATPEACTPAGQQKLEELLGRWPNSPICNTAPGSLTPVITRFDDMPYPYAAVVWDVVLPMQTLDEDLMFEFYFRQGEQFNPEKQCAMPTATPAPATPTPAVTPSPTPGASVAPSAAPASSGNAAPSASTAPASS